MNAENERKLYANFPFYTRPGWKEGLMVFGFECGDGWFPILWDLSRDIESILQRGPEELRERFQVVQVKEKYGTLRVYTKWSTEEIEDCIDRAEARSAKTCEMCSRPGETTTSNGGWVRTECDECRYHRWNKNGAIKLEPLDENP